MEIATCKKCLSPPKGSVFILSGHCNNISQTGWLKHNRNLFFVVLEDFSKSEVGGTACWGEGPVPGHGFLTVSSHGGRDEAALSGLFSRGTNPIPGAPLS